MRLMIYPRTIANQARLMRHCALALILGSFALIDAGERRSASVEVQGKSFQSTDKTVAQEREARLLEDVKYLASDELEGRGIGTQGLELAALHIAREFQEAGLNTQLFDDQPFQVFRRRGRYRLGPDNQIKIVGGGSELTPELGQDFNPLSWSRGGSLDYPLTFVGYGITAPEWNYDDYAGLDVKGHCVIIVRNEPAWVADRQLNSPEKTEQTNPTDENKTDENPESYKASDHAYLYRKIENAIDHGAAAVIFCTEISQLHDQLTSRHDRWRETMDRLIAAESAWRESLKNSDDPQSEARLREHQKKLKPILEELQSVSQKNESEVDPLLDLQVGSANYSEQSIPVMHFKRVIVDRLLQDSKSTSLKELELEIQKTQKPASRMLSDWNIAGEISVTWRGSELKNVAGLIEGQGDHSHQTIVIGAHYDHLGRGGWGSLELTSPNEIHNGADDNASGTTVLLEVARLLAERSRKEPLPRRILCLAFTAEEQGLIGSEWYVKHPLIPLDQTIAMLNLDMVGRLRKDHLTVYGTESAIEFNELLTPFEDNYNLRFTRKPEGHGPSDHSSFYGERIPVLHFFTGFHPEYHRPADDYEKLNIEGMRRIAELVADLALQIAERESPPTYQKTGSGWSLTSLLPSGSSKPKSNKDGAEPRRAFLGVFCDIDEQQKGLKVKRVISESPAEMAGIRVDDFIQQFDGKAPGSHEALAEIVAGFKPGDQVKIRLKRGDLELDVTVILQGR